jgi:hypothetical protein
MSEFRHKEYLIGPWYNKTNVLVLEIKRHYPDGPGDYNGLPTYLAFDKWEPANAQDLVEYANSKL